MQQDPMFKRAHFKGYGKYLHEIPDSIKVSLPFVNFILHVMAVIHHQCSHLHIVLVLLIGLTHLIIVLTLLSCGIHHSWDFTPVTR